MAGFRTFSTACRVGWTVSHGLGTVNDNAYRSITPQRGQDIGRNPLHYWELFLVRGFHQELAHAGLSISADDVGKSVG
jgi:hypothetical protein